MSARAVLEGTIANETLAYFIGRTFLFLRAIGINPQRLRYSALCNRNHSS